MMAAIIVIFLKFSPIDQIPIGSVHMPTVDREIDLPSRLSVSSHSTGTSTFTGPLFTNEIMKISKNKFQFHGSIRCRWMDKKTVITVFSFSIIGPWGNHYIKNCFSIELNLKLRIQVGCSWSLVDVLIFCDKMDTHVGSEFFSQHNTFSLTEYLRWIRSEESDRNFCRSDFWFSIWKLRKWSTSCQYRADFVDAMTSKIHYSLKKHFKYCTANESIDSLARQWT